MADFVVFLLGAIPALAFAVHSLVDYRKAKEKHVGIPLIFLKHTLTVLVLLELIILVSTYFTRS